jgi:hypothetical protein
MPSGWLLVLNIMRTVEAEVNAGIISDALQNLAEAITTQMNRIEDENVGQHLVSSVIVNNVRGSSFLENLSENVNISELDDRWRGEIVDAAG